MRHAARCTPPAARRTPHAARRPQVASLTLSNVKKLEMRGTPPRQGKHTRKGEAMAADKSPGDASNQSDASFLRRCSKSARPSEEAKEGAARVLRKYPHTTQEEEGERCPEP